MRDDKEIAPDTEKNPDKESAEWVQKEILPPKVEENKPKEIQGNKEKPENNEIQGNKENIEIKENLENKETAVTENPPKEKGKINVPFLSSSSYPLCLDFDMSFMNLDSNLHLRSLHFTGLCLPRLCINNHTILLCYS